MKIFAFIMLMILFIRCEEKSTDTEQIKIDSIFIDDNMSYDTISYYSTPRIKYYHIQRIGKSTILIPVYY